MNDNFSENEARPSEVNELTSSPETSNVAERNTQPDFEVPRWLKIGAVFATMFALIAGGWVGWEWYQANQSSEDGVATTEPIETLADEIIYEDEIILVPVRAAFHSRELIDQYSQEDGDRVELWSVGIVEDGEYEGENLLLMRFQGYRGPCKGPGCDAPQYARFILSDQKLIYLPQISRSYLVDSLLTDPDYTSAMEKDVDNNQRLLDFINQLGEVEIDRELTVEQLDYRDEFDYQQSTFRRVDLEHQGLPDNQMLQIKFEHTEMGEIYTTSADASLQEHFYLEELPYDVSLPMGEGISACLDEECYLSNAFYWFRPDGTFLIYALQPSFIESDDYNSYQLRTVSKANLQMESDVVLADEYYFAARSGCSEDMANYLSVVHPDEVEGLGLEVIGKFVNDNSEIYGLIDSNDAYIMSLYDRFLRLYEDGPSYGLPDRPSFEEFSQELPMFFWLDPFGRLIRFINADYTPPIACEPIIYLYPEDETEVEVRLGDAIRPLVTWPEYRNYWRVLASPDGTISDLRDGESYPYLFWEGVSGLMPRPDTGFVVRQAQVEPFFRKVLPIMGLNQTEVDDFVEAWLPDMSEAPYYQIGFYDQSVIDQYAPLHVSPPPDTTIRILFDYRPLTKPVQTIKPVITPAPERDGFTLVEWGGLKR